MRSLRNVMIHNCFRMYVFPICDVVMFLRKREGWLPGFVVPSIRGFCMGFASNRQSVVVPLRKIWNRELLSFSVRYAQAARRPSSCAEDKERQAPGSWSVRHRRRWLLPVLPSVQRLPCSAMSIGRSIWHGGSCRHCIVCVCNHFDGVTSRQTNIHFHNISLFIHLKLLPCCSQQ